MTTYPTPQMMMKATMPVMATARMRGTRRVFEAADGRGQKKGEGEGEGEGDEQLAGEVEDQDGDREHEKGPNPGYLGGSSMRT